MNPFYNNEATVLPVNNWNRIFRVGWQVHEYFSDMHCNFATINFDWKLQIGSLILDISCFITVVIFLSNTKSFNWISLVHNQSCYKRTQTPWSRHFPTNSVSHAYINEGHNVLKSSTFMTVKIHTPKNNMDRNMDFYSLNDGYGNGLQKHGDVLAMVSNFRRFTELNIKAKYAILLLNPRPPATPFFVTPFHVFVAVFHQFLGIFGSSKCDPTADIQSVRIINCFFLDIIYKFHFIRKNWLMFWNPIIRRIIISVTINFFWNPPNL